MRRLPAVLLALAASAAGQGPPPAIEAAIAHMEAKRYEAAGGLLEKLIREEPKAPEDAFLLLIDCRMRAGAAEAALQAVSKGLAAHPASVPLLKAAGRLLLRDRRRSNAAEDPLKKAVELAPEDPEAHYYLSQWACVHNQEEICVREAEKAIELSPGNEVAILQLNTLIGVAADKLNQPERADAAFRKSLASNRKLGLPDPLAAHRYVDFLQKRARDDEAVVLVEELLRLHPTFGPAWLDRARSVAKKGESEQAVSLAEKALELPGMDREDLRAAHLLLARTYFLLGREEEAAKHQAWVEENPH